MFKVFYIVCVCIIVKNNQYHLRTVTSSFLQMWGFLLGSVQIEMTFDIWWRFEENTFICFLNYVKNFILFVQNLYWKGLIYVVTDPV